MKLCLTASLRPLLPVKDVAHRDHGIPSIVVARVPGPDDSFHGFVDIVVEYPSLLAVIFAWTPNPFD